MYETVQIAVTGSGVLISALLTLGLLVLYSQMRDIQQMERRPIVEVADYALEGNSVVVWLSNYGKGSATNLQLEFEIVEPDPLPVEVESGFVQLRRESDDGVRRETSLPPEKEYIKYQSTPYLSIRREGEMKKMDWGAAVKPLSEEGVEEVRFLLRIHFSNQLGEEHSQLITPKSRGADVQPMSRLESEAHGVPPAELDPSDINVEILSSGDVSNDSSE